MVIGRRESAAATAGFFGDVVFERSRPPARARRPLQGTTLARASGWGVLLGLLVPCVAGFIGNEQHAGNEDNNGRDYDPEH